MKSLTLKQTKKTLTSLYHSLAFCYQGRNGYNSTGKEADLKKKYSALD